MKYIITLLLLLTGLFCSAQIGYIDCYPFPSKCLIVSGKDYGQTKVWLSTDTLWRDHLVFLEGDFEGNYSFTNYADPVGEWPVYIIVFQDKPTNDLEGYLLVGHEVIHLLQFLFDAYNIDFLNETESSAWLFEHLVTETYKIINK